jgi:lysophospholipase L1-like esterase
MAAFAQKKSRGAVAGMFEARSYCSVMVKFSPLLVAIGVGASLLTARADTTTSGSGSADEAKWNALANPNGQDQPAFRYVQEQPGLPRALIIGDSISLGYTTRVQDRLRGKVNVWRVPANAGSTEKGLASLDEWLSWRDHWDVIHFNFGLHDLKRQKEGSPNPDQLDVTGKISVPLEQYAKNLEQLAQRLKATGAEIIWAATTPVPVGARGRIHGDEETYNKAAAGIMASNGIRVNDLHAFIIPPLAADPHIQETVTTAGKDHPDVHFNDPGNDLLAAQVADSILRALEERGQPEAAAAKHLTLRSQGAVGDGRTDDRGAIEKALNDAAGATVDGEGLTYAVRGNIEVRGDTHFINATLVQTMDPPDTAEFLASARGSGTIKVEPPDALRSTVRGLPYMSANGVGTYAEDKIPNTEELARLLPGITLRTLSIRGTPEKPAKVTLEGITVNRGRHPQSGGRSDGSGLQIQHASPVRLSDTIITGDGKGKGMEILDCSVVRLQRVRIHDMNWAPYAGDGVLDTLTADQVKDDFGWNNFPIYEYRDGMKRFVRVRVQEQLVGLWISQSKDVEISDSTVEAIQVKIGDTLYPIQADGMTLNHVSGIAVRGCRFAKAWEGIDFTGGAGDNFLFEDCVAEDILGWGFKIAHPKQKGRMVRCRALRSGLGGFVIGAKSEDMTLTDCVAEETGAPGYWTSSMGRPLMVVAGMRIQGEDNLPTPKDITIERCAAINKDHPGAMDYGILCEAKLEGRNISLIDSHASGAKIKDISGFGADKDTAGVPAIGDGVRTVAASPREAALELR